MRELLEELARRLVDEPDAVRVEQVQGDDGSLVFRLHVAEGDVGKVIGRQGRIARALRTLVRAGGSRRGAGSSSRSSGDGGRGALRHPRKPPALEAVLRGGAGRRDDRRRRRRRRGGPQPAETLERLRRSATASAGCAATLDRELTPGEEGLAPPGMLDETRAPLTSRSLPRRSAADGADRPRAYEPLDLPGREEAVALFDRLVPSDLVPIGRVGKPHGLDGSFFVEGPSEREEAFAAGATVHVDGEPATIVGSKRGSRPPGDPARPPGRARRDAHRPARVAAGARRGRVLRLPARRPRRRGGGRPDPRARPRCARLPCERRARARLGPVPAARRGLRAAGRSRRRANRVSTGFAEPE